MLYFLQHVIDWVRKLFEHVSSCGALEGSSRHQLPLLWPFANRCFSLVCFRLPAVFEYETLGGVLFREKRRCSSNAPRSLRNLTGVRQKGYGFARPAQNKSKKLEPASTWGYGIPMRRPWPVWCYKSASRTWYCCVLRKKHWGEAGTKRLKASLFTKFPCLSTRSFWVEECWKLLCNQLEQKWQTQSRCGPNRWCLFTERSARLVIPIHFSMRFVHGCNAQSRHGRDCHYWAMFLQ